MKITPIAEEQVAEEERGYRVPFAMEVAGAWAWRIIMIAGAGWVLWKAWDTSPAGYFSSGGSAVGGSAEPRRDASA